MVMENYRAMNTRPPGVPLNYVQVSPDVWSHPSRVGSLRAAIPEQAGGKPASDIAGQTRGKGSVVKGVAPTKRRSPVGRVCLIACRNREIDRDHNLAYAFKFLQDTIADSLIPGLAAGRADSHFRWEYGQHETRGEQGTIVLIEI